MEEKKAPNADLNKKTPFFFSISLFIVLAITVTAFEWKQYGKSSVDLINKGANIMDEMMEVPPTVQPPPPAPVVQQPKIVDVPDEEEIKEDLDMDFDAEITEDKTFEPVQVQEVEEPQEDIDEIFVSVEKFAEFPGGLKAFYEFCSKHIKYPAQARRMGVEGKVIVEFVVGRDGSLTDFKVVRGLGAGLDEEAVRVLKQCPKWIPARQNARIVRQRMFMTILFKLD